MRFLRLIFLVGACAFLPTSLHAVPIVPQAHYLTSADLPPQLLPPPPDEGSAAWKKDLQGVLAAQKHISADDRKAMLDEQRLRLSLMTDVLGPDFKREKFPRAYAMLDLVLADSEAISGADKQFWHTRRPYLANAHVKLLVDRIDQSPAYPSGHAADSRVIAEVLGMLYPDRLAELRARAEAIASHRVEAGVHYPNDLEGGRLLAMLIVGALTKSEDFEDDFIAARKEIKR